jgi:hypothetical protein
MRSGFSNCSNGPLRGSFRLREAVVQLQDLWRTLRRGTPRVSSGERWPTAIRDPPAELLPTHSWGRHDARRRRNALNSGSLSKSRLRKVEV